MAVEAARGVAAGRDRADRRRRAAGERDRHASRGAEVPAWVPGDEFWNSGPLSRRISRRRASAAIRATRSRSSACRTNVPELPQDDSRSRLARAPGADAARSDATLRDLPSRAQRAGELPRQQQRLDVRRLSRIRTRNSLSCTSSRSAASAPQHHPQFKALAEADGRRGRLGVRVRMEARDRSARQGRRAIEREVLAQPASRSGSRAAARATASRSTARTVIVSSRTASTSSRSRWRIAAPPVTS